MFTPLGPFQCPKINIFEAPENTQGYKAHEVMLFEPKIHSDCTKNKESSDTSFFNMKGFLKPQNVTKKETNLRKNIFPELTQENSNFLDFERQDLHPNYVFLSSSIARESVTSAPIYIATHKCVGVPHFHCKPNSKTSSLGARLNRTLLTVQRGFHVGAAVNFSTPTATF